MTQPPKTLSKADLIEKRAEIECELRLAREYWLVIRNFLKGRILRSEEMFVAHHAIRNLKTAANKAAILNESCPVPTDGVSLPASVLVEDLPPDADGFGGLEVPEMMFQDKLKPEVLASIASQLVNKQAAKLSPDEAIRTAHELLMAAKRYIGQLPKREEATESALKKVGLAFNTVSFTEIFESNKKNSGRLPLLPPQQRKRKGKKEQELLDGPPLSLKAIKAAVKKARNEPVPQFSEEQGNIMSGIYLGNRLGLLANDQVSLEFLCTMRWERFKKFRLGQQNRVLTREAKKKNATKTKRPKARLPNSAATSPIAAGKRQK